MMDMEYNRTSPFISNCLHYSSEFHPYVGEFHYICPWYGGRKAANRRVKDGKLHDEMPSFRSQKTAFYISICNRLKVKKLWNDAEINGLLL